MIPSPGGDVGSLFCKRASPMLLNTRENLSMSLNSSLSGPTPTKVPRMLTPAKRSCSDANVLINMVSSIEGKNISPKESLRINTNLMPRTDSQISSGICLADRLVAAATAAMSGNISSGQLRVALNAFTKALQ